MQKLLSFLIRFYSGIVPYSLTIRYVYSNYWPSRGSVSNPPAFPPFFVNSFYVEPCFDVSYNPHTRFVRTERNALFSDHKYDIFSLFYRKGTVWPFFLNIGTPSFERVSDPTISGFVD